MSSHALSCIWGKSDHLPYPYPLACHLLDTAAVALHLWDSLLTIEQRAGISAEFGVPEDEARGMVAFWAALHDLGKCCPCFQGQPSGPQPPFLNKSEFSGPSGWMHEGVVRHERVTHLVLPALLAEFGYDAVSRPGRSVAHQVAQILGGHHGAYGPMLDRMTMAEPLRAEPRVGTAEGWVQQRAALVDLVHEACGRPAAPTRTASTGTAVTVTGLVVLADWLASKLSWVKERLKQWRTAGEDWYAHFRRAQEAAPQAVGRAQLSAPVWRPAATFAEAFPAIATPHPLQADLGSRLPELVSGVGLLLVTAQTGDGKTESGLFGARVLGAASGRAGLAVLLPTMATTEAMWERVRGYVARNAAEDTPVALLHGLADLNSAYTGESHDVVLGDGCVDTSAGEFVRGKHLGLTAGAAVGTWDQAAMAALPVRFNVLRWLGLSGKTLIIDEAHAYDAYGHALTVRLLEWLGHLGVPVVLLSATLSGSLARRLVNAYRSGAGHPEPSTTVPAYPGWLFADAASGKATTSPTLTSSRAHGLAVDLHEAPHTHDASKPGRARQLQAELAPLYEAGKDPGAVLVVCNTVPDAQQTYRQLTQRAGSRRPRVLLLHARMPEWRREEITATVLQLLGPKAQRSKEPLVVVSTQVAEQSLDVDFDLIVSDLAPLAQLLQRAGRGHRHALGARGHRPSWAPEPRLAVLSPTGQLPPPAWGSVYDAALLRRTRDELANYAGRSIAVPGEVAGLIDTVYAELNELAEEALEDDRERAAQDTSQAAAADAAAIPSPHRVTDLHKITDREVDPAQVTTRLGADSARLLPVYRDASGRTCLDAVCSHELPVPEGDRERLDREQIRTLVRHSLPAPAHYLPAGDPDTHAPDEWRKTPTARELRLLPHTVHEDGTITPYTAGKRTLRLDDELGLVRE